MKLKGKAKARKATAKAAPKKATRRPRKPAQHPFKALTTVEGFVPDECVCGEPAAAQIHRGKP